MLYQQMREDTFYTMNKLIVLTILVLIPSFGVCASKDKSVDEMPVKASPVGKDKTTVVDSQDINPTTNKPRSKAVELEDLPISIATQAALDLKVNTSAFAINNLTDVDTTGKATGKILKFDASGNLVVGDDLTGSGSGSLPTCTNDEDIAEWDTTTSTWVCRTYDKISQGTGITITEDGGGAGVDTINVTDNTYQPYDADLTTWAEVIPGTGAATAIAANTGAVGGLPTIIAKNTATINATTLNDASIDANSCAYQVVSVPATGVLSTDSPIVTPNASIRNVTSYGVTTAGSLRIDVYPSAGYVNFEVCNPTSAAIVPGEIILNFLVIR